MNNLFRVNYLKNSILISKIFKNTYVSLTNLSNLKTTKPTRCIFYVPGNDNKKLGKIFATPADCVVIDCEDGVALNRKQEARENIRQLYDAESLIHNDQDGKYTVRINAPLTNLALDDINTIFDVKKDLIDKYGNGFSQNLVPKTIFVPKTNTPDDIKWLYEKLNSKTHLKRLSLFFYMESATSLINLNDIIKTAFHLSENKYNKRFNLEGFVFGSDDFVADIGAERTQDAAELTYARQKLVTHCKAYKLKAIDMVYINFRDVEGLRIQSEQGAKMGFTGKQVIHPVQVDVTQKAFTPSREKIEWANGLVDAFNQHQEKGSGAFTYKGQMIDMPSLLQAKNIIEIINKVKKVH